MEAHWAVDSELPIRIAQAAQPLSTLCWIPLLHPNACTLTIGLFVYLFICFYILTSVYRLYSTRWSIDTRVILYLSYWQLEISPANGVLYPANQYIDQLLLYILKIEAMFCY